MHRHTFWDSIACNKEEAPITTKSISITKAGTLSWYLSDEEQETVSELIISGPLNGSDLKILRNLAKSCALSTLDLSDASIVAGGNSYYSENNSQPLYTTDNTIPDKLFFQCFRLKSISLPRNLKSIGEESFRYCGITSITWHEGLDSIAERAFVSSCLSGELVFPSSLRVICRQAFSHTDIKKVTIQSDITVPNYSNYYQIGGNSPFALGRRLREVVVNEGCTSLEIGFENCDSLRTVTLPSTLLQLGVNSSASYSYIFKHCKALKSITLPSNLRTIGQESFYDSGITEIHIPQSVHNIKKWAFSKTPIQTMIVDWDNPLVVNSNIFYNTNLDYATLQVPNGTAESYKSLIPWKLFGHIMENDKGQ